VIIPQAAAEIKFSVMGRSFRKLWQNDAVLFVAARVCQLFARFAAQPKRNPRRWCAFIGSVSGVQ